MTSINPGNYILKRSLIEENNVSTYVETKYVVLLVDEHTKYIHALYSASWITGLQRDMAYDFDDLLFDGYTINTIFPNEVKQSGIYKKLNKTEYRLIGHEYSWTEDGIEQSACVPYIHVAYVFNGKGHTISTYKEDFSAAMETYPNGSDVYIFGERYPYHILPPFDIETNIHTIGSEIISNLPKKKQIKKENIRRSEGETPKKRGRPKKDKNCSVSDGE